MTAAMPLQAETPPLVLASASVSRARILAGAGLRFSVRPSDIDESAVRAAMAADDTRTEPGDVAEVLARAKAESISREAPVAHVIGADQVLSLDGEIYTKPADMAEARATLLALRGRKHMLSACVCAARGGDTVWTWSDTAELTMRDLSPEFIGRYLALAGEAVLGSVGAYQLEGLGVHLFSAVRGDHFTIQGLPLLPLLEHLRAERIVLS